MSVAVEINRIIDAKKAIKKAIEDKGGSVGDSIDTYASAIDKLSVGGGGGAPTIPEIADTDPLTFVCTSEFEDGSWLSLDKKGNVPEKTFEYNKNDSGWQSYTENTHIPMVFGDKVQFRSSSTTSMSNLTNIRNFKTHGVFKCGGSIMSLFNNSKSFLESYSCLHMFDNCYITSSPVLLASADGLTSMCYGYMFNGCSLLTTAPELPATTLNTGCYQYMFQNCSLLTTAPELPATTILAGCYARMFNGCTSLVNAPALPATTLSDNCYQYMFQGCTSLVNAPELPATTLANNCYRYMFQGCTSLVNAPALPATTLATYCYQYMFQGCTSLVNAPALPATTLATYCYQYMFQGCTSLVNAPALPATTLQNYCYQYMFSGCTSLTTSPALPAKSLVSNCYGYMFNACSKLNYIKAMFTTTPSTSYTQAWVTGVASSGTFVKNSAAKWTTTGVNAVPTGWTIQTAAA